MKQEVVNARRVIKNIKENEEKEEQQQEWMKEMERKEKLLNSSDSSSLLSLFVWHQWDDTIELLFFYPSTPVFSLLLFNSILPSLSLFISPLKSTLKKRRWIQWKFFWENIRQCSLHYYLLFKWGHVFQTRERPCERWGLVFVQRISIVFSNNVRAIVLHQKAKTKMMTFKRPYQQRDVSKKTQNNARIFNPLTWLNPVLHSTPTTTRTTKDMKMKRNLVK